MVKMVEITKDLKKSISKFLDKVEKHYPYQESMRSDNVFILEFMIKNNRSIARTYSRSAIFEIYKDKSHYKFSYIELGLLSINYNSQG